ncbi:MAG: PilZ domain-containing protein [Oligoflexia bacterium]|nr:PilZ domain-containing protein [Oligoflexia bacterium]
MFKSLKNLFFPESTATEAPVSGHIYFGAEKRKHARIAYPSFGAIGRLPTIFLNNVKLPVANLSVGGFLLTSPQLNMKPGDIGQFKFTWKVGAEFVQKAKLLRVNGTHWHFKFTDVDPRFYVRFFDVTKPGDLGRFCIQLSENEIPKTDGFIEMWKNPEKYFVGFKTTETIIDFDGRKFKYVSTQGLVLDNGTIVKSDDPVIADIFLFLINIVHPSSKVRELIAQMTARYFKT